MHIFVCFASTSRVVLIVYCTTSPSIATIKCQDNRCCCLHSRMLLHIPIDRRWNEILRSTSWFPADYHPHSHPGLPPASRLDTGLHARWLSSASCQSSRHFPLVSMLCGKVSALSRVPRDSADFPPSVNVCKQWSPRLDGRQAARRQSILSMTYWLFSALWRCWLSSTAIEFYQRLRELSIFLAQVNPSTLACRVSGCLQLHTAGRAGRRVGRRPGGRVGEWASGREGGCICFRPYGCITPPRQIHGWWFVA